MAANIHYISTTNVRPETVTDSTQRLELTAWDINLLAIHVNQKGLLFHKPQDFFMWLSRLKTSLSQTLHHFFPLAGRLATKEDESDDTLISVYIDCNNVGAEFVHATVDLTISDILDPVWVPRVVHDFFTLKDSVNYDGGSQPLLSIQVTELIDGVFIGCTMNHTIADGSSFWHFINSWSEVCRTGSHTISRTPVLNRWFLNQYDSPIRFLASRLQKSFKPYTIPDLEERFFHFSPQSIAILKEKANLENNITNNTISSLQAVLAHVWMSVTRVRKLDSNQQVYYRLLMGNRERLIDPPMTRDYFGNSVNSGYATAKVGELINRGLGYAAGLLNQVVSSHTNAKICSIWDDMVKEPQFISFDEMLNNENALVTGSSPRFNMYGNDFGWGFPVAVRTGCSNKFNGKMAVFPGAVKGSIDVEACLLPKILKDLGDDREFMRFAT